MKAWPDCVSIFLLPPSYETLRQRLYGRNTDDPKEIERRLANARGEIEQVGMYQYAVVNDDLNLPGAFAALFALVRDTNAHNGGPVLEVFRRMDKVLGVIFFGKREAEKLPDEVVKLLEERAQARAAKNWAESDRLREAISALGYAVKDSKEGQSCTRK